MESGLRSTLSDKKDVFLTKKKIWNSIIGFSSPEHNMLKLSFCGRLMSIVHRQHLPCGHSRGHISSSVDLKFDQNICLKWDLGERSRAIMALLS